MSQTTLRGTGKTGMLILTGDQCSSASIMVNLQFYLILLGHICLPSTWPLRKQSKLIKDVFRKEILMSLYY